MENQISSALLTHQQVRIVRNLLKAAGGANCVLKRNGYSCPEGIHQSRFMGIVEELSYALKGRA